MKENHACMNFPLSVSAEGAPAYEQNFSLCPEDIHLSDDMLNS